MIDVQDFRELKHQFEAAIAWLCGMNLKFAPTRVGRYRKVLNELILAVESGGDFAKPVRTYYSTLAEIDELCRIQDGCTALQSQPELRVRLQKVLTGPEDSSDETKASGVRNSGARDTAFELVCGGEFARAGFPTRLPPQDDCDVAVTAAQHLLLGECKRVSSIENIEGIFSRAFEQIRTRRQSHNNPDALGMVLIDASPYFNEGGTHWESDDEHSLQHALDVFLERLILLCRQHYTAERQRLNTVAVFYRVKAICVLKQPHLVVHAHRWAIDIHPFELPELTPIHRELQERFNRSAKGTFRIRSL